MSEMIVICKNCYDAGRGWVRPKYHETEDGAVQQCPECGVVAMRYLDMGELDLGLLRKETDDNSDFEIFG